MPYKYKRTGSPFWWMGFTEKEKRSGYKPYSLKTKNSKEADLLVRDKRIELVKGNNLNKQANPKLISMSRAFELFVQDRANTGKAFSPKTIENYSFALKKLYDSVGDKFVDSYTRDDYHIFVEKMDISQNGKSVNTRCVYALFNWLKKEGYITQIPFKRIREEKREFNILTAKQIEAILKYAATTKYKWRIPFMIQSAFRQHEAEKFCKAHIEKNAIRVHGKGDKYERIVILKSMGKLLKLIPFPDDPKEPVFPFSENQMYRFWKQVKKHTGIEATSHDLRKYCLSKMANAGAPINFVQMYARHSDIKTTQKYYIRYDLENMRKVLDEKVTFDELYSSLYSDPGTK